MLTLLNRLIIWNKQSKKGSAMLMVIMTMSVILVVGTSMLFVTLSSYSRSISDTNKQKAYSAALTVSESIRSNVETILPLYSSQITSTATEAAPVPVKFASGSSGTVKKADGTTQTVENRILDINGVKVYADIYKHPSIASYACVKVSGEYRDQIDTIKFTVKADTKESYKYLEETFGNAFVMSNSFGTSDNDFSIFLKRIEGDVSIDVPDGKTRVLNAKIIEGITGSIYADGNLIIGSETNVIDIQGNIYVNGNLTIRGVNLGTNLATLYEEEFGNKYYFNIQGQFVQAKNADNRGDAMYYPYAYKSPVVSTIEAGLITGIHRRPNGNIPGDLNTLVWGFTGREDFNWSHDAFIGTQHADLSKSQGGELVPIQCYTTDSRPIIDYTETDGKVVQLEGYYNESHELKLVYAEDREKYPSSAEPVIGEYMFASPETFIDKYNIGVKNYPNFVARFPVGGNIYCSGDLIIDKANKGYVQDEASGSSFAKYVQNCSAPRRWLDNMQTGPHWVPNQSKISGNIYVRGRMVYAPDNLGFNNYELNTSTGTYEEMSVDNDFDLIAKSKESMTTLKNENSTFAALFEKKNYTWNRFEVRLKNGTYRHQYNAAFNTGVRESQKTFLTGVKNDLQACKDTFTNIFKPTEYMSELKQEMGFVSHNYTFTAPSSFRDFSDNTYTQILFGNNTNIYIQNAGKGSTDTSENPATNGATTLKWTQKKDGKIVLDEDGNEKYYTVDSGITSALTVKYHDKFNVAGIYADGDIDVVSSNVEDCVLVSNLGKTGANVLATGLNSFMYDEWSASIELANSGKTIEQLYKEIGFEVVVSMNVVDTYNGTSGLLTDIKYNAGVWHEGKWNPEGQLLDVIIGGPWYDRYGNAYSDKDYINPIEGHGYEIIKGSGLYVSGDGTVDKLAYYNVQDFKKYLNEITGIAMYSSTGALTGHHNDTMAGKSAYTNFTQKTAPEIVAGFNSEGDFSIPSKSFYLYKRSKDYVANHGANGMSSVKEIFNELAHEDFAQVIVQETQSFVSGEDATDPNKIDMDSLVAEGKADQIVCFSKDSYNNSDYTWPITFYSSNDFEKVSATTPTNAKRYSKEVFKFENVPNSYYINRDNGKWVLVWNNTSGNVIKQTNLKANAGGIDPELSGNYEGYYVLGKYATNVAFPTPTWDTYEKDDKDYYTIGDGESPSQTDVEKLSDDTPVFTIVKNGDSLYWAINGVTTSVKHIPPTISLSDNGFWILGESVTGVNAADTLDYTPKIIAKDNLWEINGVKSDIAVEYENITSNVAFIADNNGEYWLNRKLSTQVWTYDRLEKDPNLPEGGEDKNKFFTFLTGVKDDETMITYRIERNTYFNFGKLEKLSMGVTGNSMESGSLSDLLATLRLKFEVDTSEGDVILYINAYKLSFIKTTFEVKGANDFYIVLVGDTDLSANAYKLSVNTNGDGTDARLGTHFLSDNENGGNLYIVGSGQNEFIVGRGGYVNGFVYLPNGTYSNVSSGILGLTPIGTSQNNKACIVAKNLNISKNNQGKIIFTAFDNGDDGFKGAHTEIFTQNKKVSTDITYTKEWAFVGYIT